MKSRHDALVEIHRKLPSDKIRELLAGLGRNAAIREERATEDHRVKLALWAILYDERREFDEAIPEPPKPPHARH
jgi:hypothetical protein